MGQAITLKKMPIVIPCVPCGRAACRDEALRGHVPMAALPAHKTGIVKGGFLGGLLGLGLGGGEGGFFLGLAGSFGDKILREVRLQLRLKPGRNRRGERRGGGDALACVPNRDV